MGASFHVYVEGAVDPSPEGLQRLATSIAQQYGLPVADLQKRMSNGRFRVKANVDRATAETYQRALQDIGARVTVEEARPSQPQMDDRREEPRQNTAVQPPAKTERSNRYSVSPPPSSRRTVLPDPSRSKSPSVPPRPGTASSPPPLVRDEASGRRAAPSVPPPVPANSARPAGPALPPSNKPRTPPAGVPVAGAPPAAPKAPGQFQSGLAAAFTPPSGTPVAEDLGALKNDALSLSSLDGNADDGGANVPFDLAAPALPASIGPAAMPAPAPAKAKAPPVDLFAPPDAESAEAKVDIDANELADIARRRTPASGVPVAASASDSQPLRPIKKEPKKPIPVLGGTTAPEMPRARLAAGVFLSVLLGFIPAHLIAASRESSAFAAIDIQVTTTQLAADTPEAYAALDAFRDAQLARKKSEKRSIALQSLVIWALIGTGLGYVWFRRIPWDTLLKKPSLS